MKFTIEITVKTELTSLELMEQVERIGFDADDFGSRFPAKTITVEVSREYAKANREIFNSRGAARATLQLEDSQPSHWEDWGSAGPMLSAKEITEENLDGMNLKFEDARE